jgi:integrase/recombinase XerD
LVRKWFANGSLQPSKKNVNHSVSKIKNLATQNPTGESPKRIVTIINLKQINPMNQTIVNFRKELQGLGYSKNASDNYPKYALNLLNHSLQNPQNIKDKHIKDYYHYLQTKISKITKKPLSKSHIYSQLLAIKLYFEYLQRTRIIKQNPYTLKIKQPTSKERTVLTQQEIKILYQNCETLLETIILHLCYGCGLRRSEVIVLEVKDIDFEQKLLFIRKGKGKKRRVIPLTEALLKDLKNYNQSIEYYRTMKKQNFLLNEKGYILTGGSIYTIFKKLLRRTLQIEHKNYCLHSLRHSIATHLLENEMSVEMVRDFLGHSQLITTQVYTRINFFKNKLVQ